MQPNQKTIRVKWITACLSLLLVFSGSAPVCADITYTLIEPWTWPADIRNQIENSIAEAVGLYNQHGSFNKHLNIRFTTWPGVTAEANFNGDLTFGTLRNTRVALHEMAHTLGIGTIWEWGDRMVNGRWTGTHANNQIKIYDGGGAWVYGDKWHFWPYGLNYDNEDGDVNHIRHIRIVAALIADMGFLSFITEPTSRTINTGENVSFQANAIHAQGYAWYKAGNPTPLANGGNISGAATHTLHIAPVGVSDEGLYYCVATRSGTAPQASRRARLVVRRPVSHFKFSGNVYDSIGQNHGTVTGSPAYVAGMVGRAVKLNGVNDYVTLPAGTADIDDITVTAWVNWLGGNHWQRIFDFGNNTSQYMTLTPRSGSNTLRFIIRNGGGEQILETVQLATGQWVHVAVTLSGNTGTLYVNGTAVAQSGGITINPGDFTPRFNYLGKSQFSADAMFNGSIDEFRIYSYALTGTQIQNIYNRLPEIPSPSANAVGVRTQLSLTWKGGFAGENAWQTYLGTSYTGIFNATPADEEYCGVRRQEQLSTPILSPNTTYYWRVDPVLPDGSVLKGRVWSFVTGGTTAHVTPTFMNSVLPFPYAVEAVMYDQSLWGTIAAPDTVCFQKIAGPDWIQISPDGRITGTPPAGAGGQTFCTVRASDTAGHGDEAVISIQVREVCSGTRGLSDLMRFSQDWLYAEPDFNPADLNQDQSVDLDDWTLFAAEWLYEQHPGLRAAWPMDESLGGSTADLLGRSPATLRNMNMQWRPLEVIAGQTTHCLAFDGVDDYAEATGFKGVTGEQSRTCTAWIKTLATGNNQTILSWGMPSIGARWLFRVQPAGQLAVAIGGSDFIQNETVVADGRWRHVAAVLPNDGVPTVDKIKLYVDGQLQTNTYTSSSQAINTDGSQDVHLGATNTMGLLGNHFKGMMDNVQIYNRPLTDAEIVDLAHNRLVAHWPLDDGDGMIATEAKSGFDGALINMQNDNWTIGPRGNALGFNGTNQHVQVSGYKGITGTGSRTCTAWVKTAGTAGTDQMIISWGSPALGGRWMFRLQASGQPAVAVGGGHTVGNLSVADNQWHHVAAVLDSNGAPNLHHIVFYVDGVLQSATPINAHPINTGNTDPVYIGKVNSETIPSYFNGLLNDVRIYNRALTAEEIAALIR